MMRNGEVLRYDIPASVPCGTRRHLRFRWRTTIGPALNVGLNVGGTHYNVTHHFPSPGAVTPDVTTGDHDAIFGIHAGAQWQWGAWVLGAEAARSGCSHECRSTSSVLPVAQGFEENIFGEHKIIDLFTAGARLGYAWDRLLVFATGGWARPTSRTRIARASPVFAVGPATLETAP